MKAIKLISIIFAAGFISCGGNINDDDAGKDSGSTSSGRKELYKVVAHRGGYKEAGLPDCSIASMKYTITLKCLAAEIDIVATSDGYALVAHPDGNNKVNGLVPWEHTLEEIRAAGKLSNGEQIPVLEDCLELIADKSKNPLGTHIWIDCKSVTDDDYKYFKQAIDNAYRAIKEKDAFELCEFMCPAGKDVFEAFRQTAMFKEGKCECAWMTATLPGNYYGCWAQLNYRKVIENASGSASDSPVWSGYTPETYIDADIPLSLYNTTDSRDSDFYEKVIPYYPRLKAMFTNYPAELIRRLKSAGVEK